MEMTFVYLFPPIPMTSFPLPALGNLKLYSNSDLFQKSNPDSLPFPLKQEEFKKTLIVVHRENDFH